MRNIFITIFSLLSYAGLSQSQMLFDKDTTVIIDSPLELPTLTGWYDAAVGVLDSVGVAVSTTNTGVGVWQDQSGNGFHAVDGPTTAQRPIWKSSGGPSNYPWISFSQDSLGLPYNAAFKKNYVSVYMVMNYTDAEPNTIIYAYMRGTSGHNAGYRFGTTGEMTLQGAVYTTAANIPTITNAANAGSWKIFSMWQSASTAYITSNNGTPGTAVKGGANILYLSTTDSHKLGARGTGSYKTFRISELIICASNTAPTDAEVKSVVNYLNRKYDLF